MGYPRAKPPRYVCQDCGKKFQGPIRKCPRCGNRRAYRAGLGWQPNRWSRRWSRDKAAREL